MDNDKKLNEELLKADGIDPAGPTDTEREKFKAMLDNEQNKSKQNSRVKIWNIIMQSKTAKIAFAAGLIIAVLVAINHFGGSIDGSGVAWADVVEKFDSIAFFNGSVYMKENATEEPVQIEIWRNSLKKARIRTDSQVLFADDGKVIAGYAINSPVRKIETEEYNNMGMVMAQRLFSFSEFSLDTVIKAIGVTKGRLEEITPLVNPSASISKDLLVFDLQSDFSPEWMRIWVLRESRLPVRIRSWDPRDGGCVDVLMSYSTEQSAEFFDPGAYEKVLLEVKQGKAAGGRTNLAYALLDDPGGKDYTPKDLFEKSKSDSKATESTDISGYHIPTIEQAGVTEYGAVWVVASKSQNRKPDGRNFYGFSDISDDMKRKYSSYHSSWYLNGDISVQVWVPQGYPFDKQRPSEITLRCAVPALRPNDKEVLIGNVKLEQWKENALWPQKRLKQSELDLMVRAARNKTGDKEACNKIFELIRQLDKNNKYGHQIDKIRLRMFIKEKNYKEASILANKLLPEEVEVFKRAKANADYHDFYDYITAIAGNGDIQGASNLFNKIKHLEPDLSMYNNDTKKHIKERLARQVNGRDMSSLIQSLFAAGLDLEKVNRIVGFKVEQNEDTKWYVPVQFRKNVDPRTIKQLVYKKKLTTKYKAKPLEPGQMVLNKCKLKEVACMGPVPEVKDHHFYVFSTPLHEFLKAYKSKGNTGRVNRIQIDKDVDNPTLQHEIIYNSPKGFQVDKWDKYRELVMSEFGLEVIESQAEETVLIAEYDGSKLKDYRDVRIPKNKYSTSRPSIMVPFGGNIMLRLVLDSLALDQEMMVINDTGIDDGTKITQEMPNFKTAKGMELAEKWFKENFGITFRKEQRKMPVWVVRKKK